MLLLHLDRADGTLVMMGDPNQHGSVETGGAYRRLTKSHQQRVIRLSKNNRQVDEVERRAIEEYREHRIKNALALYGGAGKVVRSSTLEESHDAMVNDWFSDWKAGERSPMLAGLNTTREALNERARAELTKSGALGPESIDAAGREVRVGDWVLARKNARRLRGVIGTFVTNGSVGTVVDLNVEKRTIDVCFDREGTIGLPGWYVDGGHLDYAYARTTYGVQGKTLGRSNYQPTDMSSFEEGYVALTRGKTGTRVYVVEGDTTEQSKPSCSDYGKEWIIDGQLIAKALEKQRSKLMAHDLQSTDRAPLSVGHQVGGE